MDHIDKVAIERSIARRHASDWAYGTASSYESFEDDDIAYWQSCPSEIRFQACFSATRDAWSAQNQQFEITIDFEHHRGIYEIEILNMKIKF